MTVLGDLGVARFLADYWQREPVLIRQALPDFAGPLSPEELAGLACEAEVESRLVMAEGGRMPFELRDGPFGEADFQGLPEAGWTLLVQSVDRWVPAVADLLGRFDFLPDWRLDDIMISYAPVGGGVGPHYDQYDVFLLQAQGARRWRLGQRCTVDSPLRDHPSLKLLAEFDVTEEHVLQPGDMLYLPPGLAHDGVALEPGLTYSIGFRAPSAAEILTGLADAAAAALTEDDRYRDARAAASENPGEIPQNTIQVLQQLVQDRLADPLAIADWFGSHMTEPRDPETARPPETPVDVADLHRALAEPGACLRRNEGSRLAFFDGGTGIVLFADGAAIPCRAGTADVAKTLCSRRQTPAAQVSDWLALPDGAALLLRLINDGTVYVTESEEADA